MYKKILIAVVALTACLTGCGSQTEEEPVVTELPIKVQEVEMETVATEATTAETTAVTTTEAITETSSEADTESGEDTEQETGEEEAEKEDYLLVPFSDVNIPAEMDLSIVTINGVEVNTLDTTLQTVLDSAGITHCPWGSTNLTSSRYDFISGMFGVQTDASDISSFEGTSVSIEVVDADGNLVRGGELDSKLFGEYQVKGIHISDFFTKDDFEVLFYGGVKCGMAEEEVMASLSGGTLYDEDAFGKTYVYNNGVQTMLVVIEDGVVDEITLLNNNK